jgi:transposase
MSKALPIELRERIVESVLSYTDTKSGAARRFKVSLSTVSNLVKQYETTGSLSNHYKNCGRNITISEAQIAQIKENILATPDITLQEIKDKLALDIGISAISKIVKHKLGFNFKKKLSSRKRKIEKM